MEPTPDSMREAFEILKTSLNEAARAADATLSELIDIPSNPNEIITMFPNALVLDDINGNKAYTQTISSNKFRE